MFAAEQNPTAMLIHPAMQSDFSYTGNRHNRSKRANFGRLGKPAMAYKPR